MPVWVYVCRCYVLKESHLLNSILAMLNLLCPHPEKLNKYLYIFSHWHLKQRKQENFQMYYSRHTFFLVSFFFPIKLLENLFSMKAEARRVLYPSEIMLLLLSKTFSPHSQFWIHQGT